MGWKEADCFQWCKENNLLAPICQTTKRGGCWFCHNQTVEQLRVLRKNYPNLWQLLLQWDTDSPIPFKPDGQTIHDFEKRFALEEKGLVPVGNNFQWEMLQDKNVLCQITLQEVERGNSK